MGSYYLKYVYLIILLEKLSSGYLVQRQENIHGYKMLYTNSNRNSRINLEGPTVDRLPDNIKPIHYKIMVEPMLELNTTPVPFRGTVAIHFIVIKNTNNITLHVKDLHYADNNVFLLNSNGTSVSINEIIRSHNETSHFHIFRCNTMLLRQEVYELIIEDYTGKLNSKPKGFYLARAYNKDKLERPFATTQFQFSHAREAFPCFDEPNLKAKFQINLIRPKDYTSISNEVIVYSRKFDDKIMDVYNTTVPMSSYLVAFVIAPYVSTRTVGIQRVFSDQESINNGQGNYSLHLGVEILSILENYLNVSYPTSKIDQVAIPDDYFHVEGMENWGIVTYEKHLLVYNYSDTNIDDHLDTMLLVAHEYAHQWFGNLVTCDWWNHLWLHEGFATYFQYAIFKPHMEIMEMFLINILHYAFEKDSSNSTVLLNQNLSNVNNHLTSYIAYEKGASVIRMIKHFLSENVFKKGITRYLKSNAHQSVAPNKLYSALQEVLDEESKSYLVGDLTVQKIMETWDSQAGYPVVTVTRDYIKNTASLHQERFFDKDYRVNDSSIWFIPISFLNKNRTTAQIWLTSRMQWINYTSNDPLIINLQSTGYYRVNYDKRNWKLITNYLNSKDYHKIHALTRGQLVEDAFTMANVGKIPFEIPLDLSMYIRKGELSSAPTSAMMKFLKLLNRFLASTPQYTLFKTYVIYLFTQTFNHLGLSEKVSDSSMNKLTRYEIVEWLCRVEHRVCRTETLKLFRLWKNNNKPISKDVEKAVLCGAMQTANVDDWEFLYNKYINNTYYVNKKRLGEALGCIRSKTILTRFFDRLIKIGSTKRSKVEDILKYIADSSQVGLYTLFDYINQHHRILQTRININEVMSHICSQFTTKEDFVKIDTFLNTYYENANKCKQTVIDNIEWGKKYLKNISGWLSKNFRKR